MKCPFGTCDKELDNEGFCSQHGNSKAWGESISMILLTERLDDGYSDGIDFSNRGVFSSLDKVKQALNKEHEGYNIEHFDDGHGTGRFKVSKPNIGSAFDSLYDYTTVGLDQYTD